MKYQEIVKIHKYDTMILHDMIKKICNGSTAALVDDLLGNAVEVSCSYSHLRGDEYEIFSKYMEASE